MTFALSVSCNQVTIQNLQPFSCSQFFIKEPRNRMESEAEINGQLILVNKVLCFLFSKHHLFHIYLTHITLSHSNFMLIKYAFSFDLAVGSGINLKTNAFKQCYVSYFVRKITTVNTTYFICKLLYLTIITISL